MYRIVWKLSDTIRGNGAFCLTLTEATAWVNRMNEKYPEIMHWFEVSEPSESSSEPSLAEIPQQPPSAT